MTNTNIDSKIVDNHKADIHIYEVLIVGAAISGLAAAHRLNQAGITDYKIIERADRVGGTWRDNNYPGCGCDVPSALYSFSFAPSSKWSHLFARQPEILSYLEEVSEKFHIKPKIEFNCELIQAKWIEERHIWALETSLGMYYSKVTIFATGPITEPQTPKIDGLKTFKGETFHSARWNHQVNLSGKRIAVIGTGASAIQFIPQIQPLAKELYVFQRTAPWVIPKPDIDLNHTAKSLIDKFPSIQRTWRKSVAQSLNLINFGLRNPSLLKPVDQIFKQVLKRQIQDPELLKKVTPDFTIGCKRLLFANNYYPALQSDNTTVISSGLARIEGNTLIASDGTRQEVDVIIWGTGFNVSHPPVSKCVINQQGQRLSDLWKNTSPEAYLGTVIENVPNGFLMLGPNVLVYDSFIGLAEAQVEYIVDGLLQMKAQNVSKFTIKPYVIKEYNLLVQKHIKTTVFNSGGCKSYYLDENGRNFAAWPWSLKKLRQELSQIDFNKYDIEYSTPTEKVTKFEKTEVI